MGGDEEGAERAEPKERPERKQRKERGAARSIDRQPCGRVQVRRERKDGWTEKRRKLFLDRLAATCCVGEALRATGMGSSGLFRLRRRDVAFAEAWEDALTAHFDDVELGLLRYAKESLKGCGADNPDALAEARERARADPSFALELLKLRRMGDARVANGGVRRRIGGRVATPDKNAVAAEIMKLVRAVKKRLDEPE